jgi:hypothetical protein
MSPRLDSDGESGLEFKNRPVRTLLTKNRKMTATGTLEWVCPPIAS